MNYETGNYLTRRMVPLSPVINKHPMEPTIHVHYRIIERIFEFTLIYGLLVAGLGTVAMALSR